MTIVHTTAEDPRRCLLNAAFTAFYSNPELLPDEALEQAVIAALDALATELDSRAAELPEGWARVRGLADGFRRAAGMARGQPDLDLSDPSPPALDEPRPPSPCPS